MVLNCGIGGDSWVSLGLQGDQISQAWKKSVLNIHWKDWCWSSNSLATWGEELTHWKRPWCWERLKAGGEGDNRGWDGWMASPTQWIWVWASSGSWWRTGKSGVLQSMGSQSPTQLSDWTELILHKAIYRFNAISSKINGRLQRIRTKKFIICKTPNSQSKAEKEEQRWRNQALQFQTTLQSYSNQQCGPGTKPEI